MITCLLCWSQVAHTSGRWLSCVGRRVWGLAALSFFKNKVTLSTPSLCLSLSSWCGECINSNMWTITWFLFRESKVSAKIHAACHGNAERWNTSLFFGSGFYQKIRRHMTDFTVNYFLYRGNYHFNEVNMFDSCSCLTGSFPNFGKENPSTMSPHSGSVLFTDQTLQTGISCL